MRRDADAGEAAPLLVEGTLQDMQRIVHTKTDQARDATQRESVECGAERGKQAEGEDEAQERGQDAIDQHPQRRSDQVMSAQMLTTVRGTLTMMSRRMTRSLSVAK